MNKEMIKNLQDKTYVRAFGLMTLEEQECFKKVGAKNCHKFFTDSGWDNCEHLEYDAFTYAIKPDYQPEPEFVDFRIEVVSGHLSITMAVDEENVQTLYLHELPSLPGFECFWDKEDDLNLPDSPISLCIVCVAKRISEGHTVYARLRVEKGD
jgi:hypothetical protein